MSLGIMGLSAAFAQAGCVKKSKGGENYLLFRGSTADPTISQLSCVGEISIETIKDGAPVKQTYTDLTDASISIQADENTDIIIKGDVIKLYVYAYGSGYKNLTSIITSNALSLRELSIWQNEGLTSLDLSENVNLTSLDCSKCTGLTSLDLSTNVNLTQLIISYCTGLTSLDLSENVNLTQLTANNSGLTSLDLSENVNLTSLDCGNCTGLTSLDLSTNVNLTELRCYNCTGLTLLDLSTNVNLAPSYGQTYLYGLTGIVTIKYPATNSDISTAIAQAITDATADNGTVYTDSAADYYSTIATAATAKGWTIEQLQ